MSKSNGIVFLPTEIFERHSSDAVRYWAASARLGYDAAIDEQQIKVGRRLAIKILNASKFVLSFDVEPGEPSAPIDRAMLATLRGVVHEATASFEDYEHARALDLLERFFWGFTDDYLELVKQRAYGATGPEGAASAVGALRLALDVLLRAFAPFLPYVTEEVWSWWREGSIHRATWPDPDELKVSDGADPDVYEVTAEVLSEIRKTKALAKVSLKVPAQRVIVRAPADRLAKLELAADDLREAGGIQDLQLLEAPETSIEVELGESAA
jgi:valyl-tRNA synthetase